MKKIIKVLMWSVGLLLTVAVIAIAAFAFLFDPNALRDDITRLVEKQTGRQMTIEGDLSLSYFPWLGFEAGRTTLTNPDGFSTPIMASFESASASVKLIPLFSRRVELSQVTLDGVDLQLEVRQDGTSNWSDLETLGGADTGDDADSDGAGFSPEGVGGVRLTNTRMSYSDAQTGDRYSVSNLDLQTGPLVPGTAFALSASGDIVADSYEVSGPARLKGEVQIDDEGVIRIADPEIEMTASGSGVPGDQLIIGLQAPSLELAGTTLRIDTPVLVLNGTGSGDPYSTLKAQLDGNSLSLDLDKTTTKIDAPVLALTVAGSSETWSAIEGQLSGDTLTLVEFDRIDLPAPKWNGGITGPDLPGGTVEVEMSGQRLQGSLEHQNLAIDVVRAQLLDLSLFSKKVKASSVIDDPAIEAFIDVSEFSPLTLLAKMGYDEIVTADPTALSSSSFSGNATYGPQSMGIKNLKGKVDQTAVTGSVTVMSSGETRFGLVADEVNLDRYRAPSEESEDGAGEAVAIADIEIPSEQLKLLALDGTLKVGKMQLVGLHSTEVDIAIKAAGGDVRVKPASAKLYGGTYNGDIRLDASGDLPVLSLNERLDNVQFGPLSQDLFDSQNLTGSLNGRITVSGTGHTSNTITASSNGDAVFKFVDGAYEGTNIPAKVRRARALIKGEPAPAEPEENRTRFGDLNGTASIKDGVMTSNDIKMVMPFMKVRGSGNMVLLSQEIDFDFIGDVYDSPELDAGDNELVGFPVPIKMSGTLGAPDVGVNMGGLLAALAKRKLLEKLDLGRLLGGDAAADPDAATDTPDGEGEEKEKDAKETLEDELKDKLKGLLGGGGG